MAATCLFNHAASHSVTHSVRDFCTHPPDLQSDTMMRRRTFSQRSLYANAALTWKMKLPSRTAVCCDEIGPSSRRRQGGRSVHVAGTMSRAAKAQTIAGSLGLIRLRGIQAWSALESSSSCNSCRAEVEPTVSLLQRQPGSRTEAMAAMAATRGGGRRSRSKAGFGARGVSDDKCSPLFDLRYFRRQRRQWRWCAGEGEWRRIYDSPILMKTTTKNPSPPSPPPSSCCSSLRGKLCQDMVAGKSSLWGEDVVGWAGSTSSSCDDGVVVVVGHMEVSMSMHFSYGGLSRRVGRRSNTHTRMSNSLISSSKRKDMAMATMMRRRRRRRFVGVVRAFDFNEDGEDNEIDLDEDEDRTEEKYGTHYEVPLEDYAVTDANNPLFDDAPVSYKINEENYHKFSLHQCDFFIKKASSPSPSPSSSSAAAAAAAADVERWNGDGDGEEEEEEVVEKGKEERDDVYDFRECYVTPPDTDIYTPARMIGKMPKRPIRCLKSNWEVITYRLPPQDTPRAPYITTKYEVHKVLLIRHLNNKKKGEEGFALDFEEVYVLDGRKRVIEKANVVVELPKGRKRDRSRETFCVRDDSYRLILSEKAKTRDEIVMEKKREKAEQQLEEYLSGFRDYDESAKF